MSVVCAFFKDRKLTPKYPSMKNFQRIQGSYLSENIGTLGSSKCEKGYYENTLLMILWKQSFVKFPERAVCCLLKWILSTSCNTNSLCTQLFAFWMTPQSSPPVAYLLNGWPLFQQKYI